MLEKLIHEKFNYAQKYEGQGRRWRDLESLSFLSKSSIISFSKNVFLPSLNFPLTYNTWM